MGGNNDLFNRFLIIQKPYVLVLVSVSIILFLLLKRESLTLPECLGHKFKVQLAERTSRNLDMGLFREGLMLGIAWITIGFGALPPPSDNFK